ncbi:hypothetical protein [Falsibacillus pallidus]|uniref:ABC-2 family transporter n=1 Tax=Falsibacillus pallidus TaxID=493781 RepID=A0A370GG34_9BACI|nr:hypothetical protein [Falsibacillus pallidus]RDI41354.1 hypothetical protein DFR59_1084 [Falsibacillus pallidus]
MRRQKFHIPMPDDETVKNEVRSITRLGLKQKEPFFPYMLRIGKVLGFKYLFTNTRDGMLLTISTLIAVIFFLNTISDAPDIYGAVFLISPLLFMSLSLYELYMKKQNATFEVEMTAKYNLYQISAFRMLHFSILSIAGNTISFLPVVWKDSSLEFFTLFMISTTSLFIFAIVFLFVYTKKRSGLTANLIGMGWILANIGLRLINANGYNHFLMSLPAILYGIVLIGSVIIYLYYLSKLIRMNVQEGAL